CAHGSHATFHPAGHHVRGIVGTDLADADGRKVTQPRRARHTFEPVVAQGAPFGDCGVGKRDLPVTTRDEMVDSQLADRQVWISKCGKGPDLDVRYARCLHSAEGGRTEWKQTRDRDRVEILDRVDDMLIVLGLEDLYLKQTLARQFGGHSTAGLHRHL